MTKDDLLRARCVELATQWTPWDRRVWQPGTILSFRELIEAAEWSARGVLSDEAVQWLRASLRPEIGKDPGLSAPAVRAQLEGALKDPLKHASQRRRELERLTEWLDRHYLEGWQAAVGQAYDVERAARYMTSHLIDAGHHPEFLRKHLEDIGPATATELIEDLRSLAAAPPQEFRGWVLLTDVPELPLMRSRNSWMSPREVAQAMRSIDQPAPRGQSGALRFQLHARDRFAAASLVRDELERLVNRTKFLRTTKRLRYESTWWLEDGSSVRLAPRQAAVSAMSLSKSEVLYTLDQQSPGLQRIDDAFELGSHLIASPPAVAVSSAWAALESLLIDPQEADRSAGGRVVAADRAAAITAAGWPRAELTRLSYRLADPHNECPTVLRHQLEEAGEDNVRRCHVLLENWASAEGATGLPPTDAAAVNRVSQLTSNPSATLGRVQTYMQGSFRRLYRQRNLIMHGGAVRSVALASTARTTGPLVGALLDRIVVAAHLEARSPLDAVAAASVNLAHSRRSGDLTHLFEL